MNETRMATAEDIKFMKLYAQCFRELEKLKYELDQKCDLIHEEAS